MGISAILLASGLSKRMGENKLYLELEGKKVYTYSIEILEELLRSSYIDEVLVVSSYELILKDAKKFNFKTVYNKDNMLGKASSIKLGLKNAKAQNNYLFMVADQPLLRLESVEKLIDEFNSKKKITMLKYKDILGNPVIFPNICREELLKLSGDQGGREIIKVSKSYSIVRVTEEELFDIDTIDDYHVVKNYLKRGERHEF